VVDQPDRLATKLTEGSSTAEPGIQKRVLHALPHLSERPNRIDELADAIVSRIMTRSAVNIGPAVERPEEGQEVVFVAD
jgi:hypothetical protein